MMRPTITIPTATLEALIAEAREALQAGGRGNGHLSNALGALHEEQLSELVALSSIGYSVQGEQEWATRLLEARAMDGAGKMACLLEQDALADLLEDALIEIGCALMTEQESPAA